MDTAHHGMDSDHHGTVTRLPLVETTPSVTVRSLAYPRTVVVPVLVMVWPPLPVNLLMIVTGPQLVVLWRHELLTFLKERVHAPGNTGNPSNTRRPARRSSGNPSSKKGPARKSSSSTKTHLPPRSGSQHPNNQLPPGIGSQRQPPTVQEGQHHQCNQCSTGVRFRLAPAQQLSPQPKVSHSKREPPRFTRTKNGGRGIYAQLRPFSTKRKGPI